MKHKRLLGYGGIGIAFIAIGVAFIKPFNIGNFLIRARADMANLSVTFNYKGAQSHTDNETYYRSATTSLGSTFYLRNRSNISPTPSQVAVMCGNNEKGSIENEITFTTTNTGTSLFRFKNIKSISAVSNSSYTRTLTVFKSSNGTSWSDAGTLAFDSSGGTNTDVSGANYIKLTYPDSFFTVYITSFTINYSCSDEPVPSKELSSISVSGEKTEFTVGDTFSFGGTVTAHYSDSTTSDVTSSATFAGYDMNSEGEQTVTVTYTEDEIAKTTTYKINISEVPSENPLETLLKSKQYVLTVTSGATTYRATFNFNTGTLSMDRWASYDTETIYNYTQSFTLNVTSETAFSFMSITAPDPSPSSLVLRLHSNTTGQATITDNVITSLSISIYKEDGTGLKTLTLVP